MSLGKTVSRLRKEKGWTQIQLAEALDMHPNHINRVEKDRIRPRVKTLERMAQALGVTIDMLTAAAEGDVPTGIAREDPELADLLSQLPLLDEDQRHALRTFLRSMIACQQVQRITSGGRRQSRQTA
ncbi:MAG: helix-turn-helix transcriptional regulator [Candidatus Eremiobacterota bacterium]